MITWPCFSEQANSTCLFSKCTCQRRIHSMTVTGNKMMSSGKGMANAFKI